MLCFGAPDCYQVSMSFRPIRPRLAVILLLAGCAHPPAPAPVVARPVAPGPSTQALRAEWLKGYAAGVYDGRRQQARRDQALLAKSTLPPPPPPDEQAAPAPAVPAPVVAPPAPIIPVIQTPPQSVFIPAGPAKPVVSNP